jgi:branched-chain amino acid aminotransferase
MKIWKDCIWREMTKGVDLPVTPAFQFGFGLFETICVRKNRPLNTNAHIQRMTASIAILDSKIQPSFTIDTLSATITNVAAAYSEPEGVLKVIAYRTDTSWDLLLTMRPFPYSAADYTRGFSLRQSTFMRNPDSLLVRHKTLNYLENYLERLKAKQEGYDDAFFLNTAGSVTECSASNIFIVADNNLITPPAANGLLPGTMRAQVLAMASSMGLNAKEAPMTTKELMAAKCVFVTNALLGAMPVSRINGTPLPIDSGLITALNKP